MKRLGGEAVFGGAGRNLGAGDGWRGRMNLVMKEPLGNTDQRRCGVQSEGTAWDLRGRKGK